MALINEYLNASAAKINIPTPFILKGQAPLDLRQIVLKKEDLILANFYDGDAPFWYPGMLVSCVEDSKVYILKEKVEVDEATQEEVKSYEFVEVTPDLPENATKNTTYDLASVLNTDKGQIQLSNSDDTSVDTVSIEGDGSNIKVSSTAAGVKVEHIVPTKGDALTASATTKEPGYAGTFTAVTGLTKDANGHIVSATLETIKLPGKQDLSGYKTKQTAVADVAASGTASTVVTSVTQNANGEITVTKANLPAESVKGVTLNDTDVVGEDKIARITAIEGIVKDDKVLSLNGHNIMSTLSLDYVTEGEGEAEKKYIVLKGINGVEIDRIDASDFIADSFLNDVEIKQVDGKDILYFTWAMADGTTKTDSVDLSKYINIYTGADKQIVVSESNVIGLAEHKAEAATGKALTPAHGGSFNVITGVTTDDYGRVNSVETSQVTLPTIDNGTLTGTDEYVTVGVKTTAGVVSEVTVNTDALTEKIEEIETVTSAALNDLNVRVSGIEAEYVKSVTSEEEALNNSSYVSVHAATEDGRVTLTSTVEAVDATDTVKYPSTGLATDGYVKLQIASVSAVSGTAVQNIKSEGLTITVERQAGSNDVNLELMWASF